MAANALRDDIFSILQAFASPRQGPQDNTALISQAQTQPKPPEPPQGPLPFTPPEPVTSKVVPQADLPAPGARPAQAGGEGTGFNIPPGPQGKPPTPPQTGFAGGRPAQGAAPPADVPAESGGLDVFQIWQAQQDKALKANALERLASGGQMMLGGMTRSPSMRESLFRAAESGGGRGGGGGGGGAGGDLSFENLLNLQKLGLAQQQRASLIKQLPGIAKQTGTDIARLRLMADTDPDKLAEYVATVSKPDTQKRELEDGTIATWDAKDPEGTYRVFGQADPGKVAARKEAALKSQQEGEEAERKKGEYGVLQGRRTALKQLAATQPELGLNPAALDAMSDSDASALLGKIQDPNLPLEERKVAVSEANSRISASTEARQQEAAPGELEKTRLGNIKTKAETGVLDQASRDRMLSDQNIAEFSTFTGIPTAVAQSMSVADRSKAITDRTAEQQTLDRINLQRKKQGLSALTDEEYRTQEQNKTIQIKQTESGFGTQAAAAVKANEEAETSSAAMRKGFATRQAARSALLSGKGIIAGSSLAGFAKEFQKLRAAVTGNPSQKVENTEVYAASMAGEVLSLVKNLGAGTAISNTDLAFAERAAAGELTLNQESMRRLLGIRDNLDRRLLQENNEKMDRRYKALPGLARINEPSTIPDMQAEQKRYVPNEEITQLLSNPDYLPVFEEMYGRGAADQVLAKPDELLTAKMRTLSENKTYDKQHDEGIAQIKKAPLAFLQDPATRQRLEADWATKYGSQAEGLYDLVLALKAREGGQ